MDALGAFITAILLFFVLKTYQEFIGISSLSLTMLAALGVIFGIYSILCFLLTPSNWRFCLRFIGIANILYCILTIFIVISSIETITIIGIGYFVLEVIIIIILAAIELKSAAKL